MAISDVVAALDSDPDRGLTTEGARRHLERYRANALPEPSARSLVRVFIPVDFSIVLALGLVGSAVLWVEELRKWIVRGHDRSIHRSMHDAMPARGQR